jgi:ElaB/YqjD/DUF883 family membrane-anchored ribosome-binding protein
MAKRKKHDPQANVEARISALKDDLESLQADIRGLAGDVGDLATDRAKGAISSAEEAAYAAGDQLENWANENVEEVRDQVRSQPLAAMLLSMSAGALVGAWLLRR